MKDNLTALQRTLNYSFSDENLLIQAITHSTFAYESQKEDVADNQRLEFLGDSILNMVVAEHLYIKNPQFSEGELTRRRSLLVNRNILASKAKQLNLSEYLRLGKGESKIGGAKNATNLCCTLEAIIGAIYLDGRLEKARKFIIQKIIE